MSRILPVKSPIPFFLYKIIMKKFVIGLLAGISAGLLFAPKAGKKFREELKTSDAKFTAFGNALADAAKDVGGEVRTLVESKDVQELLASGKESAEKLLNVLQQKSTELSEQAKKQLNDAVTTAAKKADGLRSAAKDKVNGVKKSGNKAK